MNRQGCFLFILVSFFLHTQGSAISVDEMEYFYDVFVCEEENELSSVGLAPGCNALPPDPPGPPRPPVPPTPPTPGKHYPITPIDAKGRFPVVITNNTQVDPERIYIFATSPTIYNSVKDKIEDFAKVYQFVKQPGIMESVRTSTDNGPIFSANYSYPLSLFPKAETGNENDYLLYFPFYTQSVRIYFSFDEKPLLSNTKQKFGSKIDYNINAPAFNYNDPNYNVLWDFMEISIPALSSPEYDYLNVQPFMDNTQVDSLGTPVRLDFYSYNETKSPKIQKLVQPAILTTNPAGYDVSRIEILQQLKNTTEGLGKYTGTWDQLIVPFYQDPYTVSTLPGTNPDGILRVLSVKHAVGGAGGNVPQPQGGYNVPAFPNDFLVHPSYGKNGETISDQIFEYYQGKTLWLKANETDLYAGTVSGSSGSYAFTFTLQSDSTNQILIRQEAFLEGATNSAPGINGLYSGTTPVYKPEGSTASASQQAKVADFFSVGFASGLLGSGTLFQDNSSPLNTFVLQEHIYGIHQWVSGTAPGATIKSPSLYQSNPFGAGDSPSQDVYAQILHRYGIAGENPPYPADKSPSQAPGYPQAGLLYAYDYDDELGFSSTLALNTNKGAESLPGHPSVVFARFTLQNVNDYIKNKTITNAVFNDSSKSFNLTFSLQDKSTIYYRRSSSEEYTQLDSSKVVQDVISTTENPFQIKWKSESGNNFVEATLFPYFQFVQPVGAYSELENTHLLPIQFVPNNDTNPTAFTVQLQAFP